jgi:hemin uptake protein HemP
MATYGCTPDCQFAIGSDLKRLCESIPRSMIAKNSLVFSMDDSAEFDDKRSPDGPPSGPEPARWHSEDILKGGKEAIILHHGASYRLRVTRQGKLILYK